MNKIIYSEDDTRSLMEVEVDGVLQKREFYMDVFQRPMSVVPTVKFGEELLQTMDGTYKIVTVSNS